jgi:predicted metal-dependent HD superfamily phosphohydrolase
VIEFYDLIKSIHPETFSKYIIYVEKGLKNLYLFPKREYHTWRHVMDCLEELENTNIPGLLEYRDIIALSIFYHDCIYCPMGSNNERLSAERAFIDLMGLGLGESYAKKIHDHIILTTHKKPCDFLSGQILMDIDMSILGKSIAVFKCYEYQIKEEYRFVLASTYKKERVKFLNSLLKKNRIYQTKYFQDKYEETARDNIKNLVNELTSPKVTKIKFK